MEVPVYFSFAYHYAGHGNVNCTNYAKLSANNREIGQIHIDTIERWVTIGWYMCDFSVYSMYLRLR